MKTKDVVDAVAGVFQFLAGFAFAVVAVIVIVGFTAPELVLGALAPFNTPSTPSTSNITEYCKGVPSDQGFLHGCRISEEYAQSLRTYGFDSPQGQEAHDEWVRKMRSIDSQCRSGPLTKATWRWTYIDSSIGYCDNCKKALHQNGFGGGPPSVSRWQRL